MDLDSVAGELYGLLPEDFSATRNLRAGEARAAGDRDLAAAIRRLRRPTTSAWLANLLVRERPTEISQLLELGTAMHRAQSDLLGEEMRQLSRQRQQVVTSLSDAARQLAHGVGMQASDATMRELEETLEAAIVDAAARDALASGRLATAMRYSGLGAGSRGLAIPLPPRRRPGGTARDAAPKEQRETQSARCPRRARGGGARSPTTEGDAGRRPVQPGHRGGRGPPAFPAQRTEPRPGGGAEVRTGAEGLGTPRERRSHTETAARAAPGARKSDPRR